MVAGIKVTIMFDDGIASAGRCESTYPGLDSTSARQGSIKIIDEKLSYIIFHPAVRMIF